MSKKFIANHKKEPCYCLPRESHVSLEDKKRHEKCGHCYDIHKNVSWCQKTWRKKLFKCVLFQRLLPCYQGGVSISKKYLLLRGHLFRYRIVYKMLDTQLSWHFHRLFLWSEADFCLSQFKMQSLFFQHLWVKTRKQNYQVRTKRQ